MQMPFAFSVQEKIQTLAAGSPKRLILEYLWANARGRANRQPWEAIAGWLRAHDVRMEKESFQTGLLASTREGGIFIGSSRDGFYLIENRKDAEATMEFIKERLESHNRRLRHLNSLVKDAGWEELPLGE